MSNVVEVGGKGIEIDGIDPAAYRQRQRHTFTAHQRPLFPLFHAYAFLRFSTQQNSGSAVEMSNSDDHGVPR